MSAKYCNKQASLQNTNTRAIPVLITNSVPKPNGLQKQTTIQLVSYWFCPISPKPNSHNPILPKPISSIGKNNRTLTLNLFLTLNVT